MLLELHQIEAGACRVAALVAALDDCALPGLLAVLAGENAEADRHGVLHGKTLTRAALPGFYFHDRGG